MADTQKIIDEYIEKFGFFPSFYLMGKSDEEIAEILTECLRKGKPLKIKYDPDADY